MSGSVGWRVVNCIPEGLINGFVADCAPSGRLSDGREVERELELSVLTVKMSRYSDLLFSWETKKCKCLEYCSIISKIMVADACGSALSFSR